MGAEVMTRRTEADHDEPDTSCDCDAPPVQHRLFGNVCLCGDWSAGCGNDVPEQWRQHVNLTDQVDTTPRRLYPLTPDVDAEAAAWGSEARAERDEFLGEIARDER